MGEIRGEREGVATTPPEFEGVEVSVNKASVSCGAGG